MRMDAIRQSSDWLTKQKKNSHISPQERVMVVMIAIVCICVKQLSIVTNPIAVIGE